MSEQVTGSDDQRDVHGREDQTPKQALQEFFSKTISTAPFAPYIADLMLSQNLLTTDTVTEYFKDALETNNIASREDMQVWVDGAITGIEDFPKNYSISIAVGLYGFFRSVFTPGSQQGTNVPNSQLSQRTHVSSFFRKTVMKKAENEDLGAAAGEQQAEEALQGSQQGGEGGNKAKEKRELKFVDFENAMEGCQLKYKGKPAARYNYFKTNTIGLLDTLYNDGMPMNQSTNRDGDATAEEDSIDDKCIRFVQPTVTDVREHGAWEEINKIMEDAVKNEIDNFNKDKPNMKEGAVPADMKEVCLENGVAMVVDWIKKRRTESIKKAKRLYEDEGYITLPLEKIRGRAGAPKKKQRTHLDIFQDESPTEQVPTEPRERMKFLIEKAQDRSTGTLVRFSDFAPVGAETSQNEQDGWGEQTGTGATSRGRRSAAGQRQQQQQQQGRGN